MVLLCSVKSMFSFVVTLEKLTRSLIHGSLCVPTSPFPSSSYPFLKLYALTTLFGLLITYPQEMEFQRSLQNSPNMLIMFLISAKESATQNQLKLDNNYSSNQGCLQNEQFRQGVVIYACDPSTRYEVVQAKLYYIEIHGQPGLYENIL